MLRSSLSCFCSYAANLQRFAEPLLDAAAETLDKQDAATAVLDAKLLTPPSSQPRANTATSHGTTLSANSKMLASPPAVTNSDPYDKTAWNWLLTSPMRSGGALGKPVTASARKPRGGLLSTGDVPGPHDAPRTHTRAKSAVSTYCASAGETSCGRLPAVPAHPSAVVCRDLTVRRHLAFPDDDPEAGRRSPMGASARMAQAAAKHRAIQDRYPASLSKTLPTQQRAFARRMVQGVDATFERPNMLIRARLNTAEGVTTPARPIPPSALVVPTGTAATSTAWPVMDDGSSNAQRSTRASASVVSALPSPLPSSAGLVASGAVPMRTPRSLGELSSKWLPPQDPRRTVSGEHGVATLLTQTWHHKSLTKDGRKVLAKLHRSASAGGVAVSAAPTTPTNWEVPTTAGAATPTRRKPRHFTFDTPPAGSPPVATIGEMLHALGELPQWAQQQLHLHPHQVAAGVQAGLLPSPTMSAHVSRYVYLCGGVGTLPRLIAHRGCIIVQCFDRMLDASTLGGISFDSEGDFRDASARQRWAPSLDVITMLPGPETSPEVDSEVEGAQEEGEDGNRDAVAGSATGGIPAIADAGTPNTTQHAKHGSATMAGRSSAAGTRRAARATAQQGHGDGVGSRNAGKGARPSSRGSTARSTAGNSRRAKRRPRSPLDTAAAAGPDRNLTPTNKLRSAASVVAYFAGATAVKSRKRVDGFQVELERQRANARYVVLVAAAHPWLGANTPRACVCASHQRRCVCPRQAWHLEPPPVCVWRVGIRRHTRLHCSAHHVRVSQGRAPTTPGVATRRIRVETTNRITRAAGRRNAGLTWRNV